MAFPLALTPEEIDRYFVDVGAPADNTFELALVLGGTVSAGAYTAGVVDFLVEALDEWTAQRDVKNANPDVPPHRVVLKLITGTSGGGVTASVLARALAYNFPHVTRATDPTATTTGNPLYDIWVNDLTMSGFLGTSDIDQKNFVSLLNGDVINAAAKNGTSFSSPQWRTRSWLSDPLRVILTLTNLHGIPVQTQFAGAAVGLGESFVNHADFARFAFIYPGRPITQPRPDEFVLGFGGDRYPQALDWQSFAEFAKATAAFPLGFPPRALVRPMEHLRWRAVVVPGDGTPQYPQAVQPLIPNWSALVPEGEQQLPSDYRFLVVDGGATDNEPIELARSALAGVLGRNPRSSKRANRGVLLIDPFAGSAPLGPDAGLTFPNLPGPIVQAMIQQTRYDTADILLAADENVFSRFMITPMAQGNVGEKAIASAGFQAFIGFACRDFMRYDYLLGRYNAQQYLRTEFVLDADNPVFASWPATLKQDPNYKTVGANGEAYLPIIPLMGNGRIPETLDPWPKGKLDPETYRDAIDARFRALIEFEGSGGLLSSVAGWLVAHLAQHSVADLVISGMNAALGDWHLD